MEKETSKEETVAAAVDILMDDELLSKPVKQAVYLYCKIFNEEGESAADDAFADLGVNTLILEAMKRKAKNDNKSIQDKS